MTMPRQKPGQSKQDYATPRAFIAAVKQKFHIEDFVVDLAADETNSVVPGCYFDEALNTLSCPPQQIGDLIGQGWGWLNPPYADIEPWAKLCYDIMCVSEAKIAFLVPASVGANWYRDWIHHKAQVWALNGRLAFIPDEPQNLYPKDCMLVVFSKEHRPWFEVWTWTKE